MKLSKLFFFSFIFLFSLSLVFALDVPSQTRTTHGVCEILTPDFTELKQNTDFTFYFHVYNDTSFIDNADANCTFHLYSVSDKGLHILQVTGEVPFLPIRDFYAFVNGTTNLSDIGRYSYLFECGVPKSFLKGAQSDVCGLQGEFEVTTGIVQTNLLENPMILIFVLLGFALVIIGMAKEIPWFGFIGSLMFLLAGIYTMIYGFNNTTDLYTRGIAVTLIGIGFIFMFTSSYEWLFSEKEETGEG